MDLKEIWKYELRGEPDQAIDMPKGAVPLSVQMQHGKVCLWAMVWPGNPKESRSVRLVPTGLLTNAAQDAQFVGTVQLYSGDIVLHVFVK